MRQTWRKRPMCQKGRRGLDLRAVVGIREAALRTGRSEAAIYHLIATGQLPAQPTASRGLSIHPKDLEQLERQGTGSRRSGWSVQSLWEWIRQRGQATVRQLRAGMRSLSADMPGNLPGPPWYWLMPWCAPLALRW
jgi:predicted DNA-binding transcriptional regulator AlpA